MKERDRTQNSTKTQSNETSWILGGYRRVVMAAEGINVGVNRMKADSKEHTVEPGRKKSKIKI